MSSPKLLFCRTRNSSYFLDQHGNKSVLSHTPSSIIVCLASPAKSDFSDQAEEADQLAQQMKAFSQLNFELQESLILVNEICESNQLIQNTQSQSLPEQALQYLAQTKEQVDQLQPVCSKLLRETAVVALQISVLLKVPLILTIPNLDQLHQNQEKLKGSSIQILSQSSPIGKSTTPPAKKKIPITSKQTPRPTPPKFSSVSPKARKTPTSVLKSPASQPIKLNQLKLNYDYEILSQCIRILSIQGVDQLLEGQLPFSKKFDCSGGTKTKINFFSEMEIDVPGGVRADKQNSRIWVVYNRNPPFQLK